MSEEIKQTIIVTRDGQIDEAWLDNLEAAERRIALKQAGRNLLNKLSNVPNRVGEITLNLLTIIEDNRI